MRRYFWVFFLVAVCIFAQAVPAYADTGSTSEKQLLGQIDSAQTNILSHIPPAVREKTTTIISYIEAWRNQQADIFTQKQTDAQVSLTQKQTDAHVQTATNGAVSPATSVVDIPLAKATLMFFTALVAIFANQIAFYTTGVILIIVTIRFIVRKIAHAISHPRKRGPFAKGTWT